jgi:2-octaprenyl-6-methoxyphenol hydroxylase
MSEHHVDVAICGGGPVGMALALSLGAAGRSCVLLDARPASAPANGGADLRTLALSYGSRLLLERLGVWESLHSTPILQVNVSQQAGFGRTMLDAADEQVPALGYVTGFAALEGALQRACAAKIEVRQAALVTGIDHSPEGATVNYTQDGRVHTISANLIAVADGGASIAGDSDAANPHQAKSIARDYRQTAVVADVTPAEPHRNRAWERFGRDGPIALLPKGADYALVWSVRPEVAAALAAAPDSEFLARLGAAMGAYAGNKTGRFITSSPRGCFPLGLRYRRDLTGARTLSLGNAAQTLHPVAGQGLNLGLRDVWALTTALAGQADSGSAGVLTTYAASRRLDRYGTIGFTDLLARVFTIDSGLMRVGRGAALTLFDLLPPARHFLARRMIYGASAWP